MMLARISLAKYELERKTLNQSFLSVYLALAQWVDYSRVTNLSHFLSFLGSLFELSTDPAKVFHRDSRVFHSFLRNINDFADFGELRFITRSKMRK